MVAGPAFGARVSNVRIRRSTPAVARMVERYLFQSWVRASLGGKGPAREVGVGVLGEGCCWAEWIGIVRTRWLEAELGVRRSKRRRRESEEAEERREGEWGEKEAE